MKQTWQIMGMPVSLTVLDEAAGSEIFQTVRDYFRYVDEKYSPYKPASEVSRINAGLPQRLWSDEMKAVWQRCLETSRQTSGFFNVMHEGRFDPSGLVKGWAIHNAAGLLRRLGFKDYYVEAGGDVEVSGRNETGRPWLVGIRNPFDRQENVKILSLSNRGIATSGTYIRGQHIYNPHDDKDIKDVASLTVIGPDIYEADRFATAAFAMGTAGINFIESLPGFEAYMITADKLATLTSGFEKYAAAGVAA
jgi:thiamine biosynthesis lipoprotein